VHLGKQADVLIQPLKIDIHFLSKNYRHENNSLNLYILYIVLDSSKLCYI
jgi:hypothetical protein